MSFSPYSKWDYTDPENTPQNNAQLLGKKGIWGNFECIWKMRDLFKWVLKEKNLLKFICESVLKKNKAVTTNY